MSLKKNIIYLHFKGKHLITSKSQYQYNYGQYLYFTDLNLPQAFEVHFSNKERGESETQIGSNKLVEIPDKFFWSGALEIYAWVYLHNETDDGETIYEVRIPLIKRARPTDKEPLPDQQSAIDKAIAELNNAVNITNENANKTDSDKIIVSNIKEDVITLKENIDSTATIINQKAQETIDASERAEISAQNAATSENKALNYSQQAEQSAQSALESKNIAQQKSEVATNASNEALGYRDEALEAKNQAVQAKQNIVDYRDETKGYRDETLNFKNDVQTLKNQIDETAEEIEDISDSVKEDAQSASLSASSASQSANSASQSANSASQAQGFANNASSSAQSASQSASGASASAQTASAKASEASQSATMASQKATESAQSASQALSYKTDAESAKVASQTAQGLAESARDTAVQAKTDAESARDDAVQAKEDAESAVASISGALADKAPVITDTTSGAIASFTDGADDLPLKSLVVDINPVQDLHGQDAPYPAGGGKNLCSDIASDYTKPVNYWVWHRTLTGGTYYIAVTPKSGAETGYAFVVAKSGDAYTEFVDVVIVLTAAGATYNRSFIVDSTWTNPVIGIYCPSGKTVSDFFANYTVQLEKNATATAYAPYENICPISGWTEVNVNHSDADMTNPTTLTVQLGQTVYGGKLDVLGGVMRVDRATDDMGNLTWSAQGSAGRCYSTSKRNTIKKGASAGGYDNALAEIYSASNVPSMASLQANQMSVDNGGNIQLYDTRFAGMTGTQIKAELQGVTMCYKLAEPIEIQLTPNQVNSLLGVNNLWADSGDTEVEYRADTKLFIERLTAPDSADMIADANITSGQYFMVGNSLYKATANIANGASIIVGTNCTRVSLAQALNEINA